ncbi:DUF418 domain-containing protein [Tindallia californiensis]|uniref:DUF418 domain-containing protein n=1 Tax=Tindallia californiensis TaxID=159292 RepID=A0A1H3J0L8_9FIRM|nr:DUF418 domain-containing protein [Tindallia californiensis]SDY33099.1 uncharacterized protein SAMN05192546_101353 [Tindallia californiensis]
MTNQQQKPIINSINKKERMDILDILRGFAIFGILAVNIVGMAGPVWLPGYIAPIAPWYDEVATFLMNFLATGKFYVIFSFLFGLGFSVQMMRAEEKGINLRSFYPRRLTLLFILGMIHSVFFFYGDILRLYAVLGFLLMVFRKRRNRTLIIWAIIFLVINFVALGFLGGPLVDAGDVPDEMNIAEMAREIHLEGSFLQVSFFQGIVSLAAFVSVVFVQGGTVMALFLLGLLVGRMNLLSKMKSYHGLIKKIFVWTLIFGTSFNGAFIIFAESPWLSSFFWIIGAPILGTAYVMGLCLIRRRENGEKTLLPIANVGRMALTNYLMHSVIGSFIFNGYGIGMYDQVGAAGLWGITIIIYLLQIIVSNWWLSHYHFGPMEWLWRTLTYKQRQPFRKKTTVEEAAG